MRKILIVLTCLPALAWALPKKEWALQSGTLTYHVKYVLKKAEGVSKNVKGKGQCEGAVCEFLVAAPVKSFDSGDGNRDAHMLEVTRGSTNPMVVVRAKFPDTQKFDTLTVDGTIQFAGKEHEYKGIPVTVTGKEGPLHVRGTIPMKLKDFAIEAPSLLGISIDDLVPVDFDLVWN
jgi:hypothetical protein